MTLVHYVAEQVWCFPANIGTHQAVRNASRLDLRLEDGTGSHHRIMSPGLQLDRQRQVWVKISQRPDHAEYDSFGHIAGNSLQANIRRLTSYSRRRRTTDT